MNNDQQTARMRPVFHGTRCVPVEVRFKDGPDRARTHSSTPGGGRGHKVLFVINKCFCSIGQLGPAKGSCILQQDPAGWSHMASSVSYWRHS